MSAERVISAVSASCALPKAGGAGSRTASLGLLLALCGLLPLDAVRAGVGSETGAAQAQPTTAALAPREARAWLDRLRTAARERNYQGTMVFTAGQMVSSSRVAHFSVADQSFERVEALDGRQQRSYRHNDLIHTFWPATRVATVERRDAWMPDVLRLPALEPRLQEHYELRVLGLDHWAGHGTQVLLLKPRDDLRFALRVWADSTTHLMLRADVLGPRGEVLESSAFTDLEIGVKPSRDSVLQPMKKLEGFRVVALSPAPTTLEAEGWVISRLPAGFVLAGCVRRGIGDVANAGAAPAADVTQAVFSDGLARVSVFIEPYDPSRPRKALMTQMGATHTLMKPRFERWWVTVMGDVPPATLMQIAAALERRP